jgi:hypothetical protein
VGVDLYLTKKTRKKAGKALDDGKNVEAKSPSARRCGRPRGD